MIPPASGAELNRMAKENGLVQVASHYSVDETMERLQSAFAEKGLQTFAVIDHSGEAEKAGLKMLVHGHDAVPRLARPARL